MQQFFNAKLRHITAAAHQAFLALEFAVPSGFDDVLGNINTTVARRFRSAQATSPACTFASELSTCRTAFIGTLVDGTDKRGIFLCAKGEEKEKQSFNGMHNMGT